MPELPEVETVARRLQELLPGKKIAAVDQLHERSLIGSTVQLLNSSITQVSRRAKLINIQLDSSLHLLTHLKMTGQLIYVDDQIRVGGGHPTADWIKNLPGKHTRIIYHFTDNSKLYFNDQRIFGWMRLMSADELASEFAKYAVDIKS